MNTPSISHQGGYAFGDIRVEPKAHRVLCRGHELELEPKAYSVLLEFLARPGELISRDDMLDRVWGHRHATPATLSHVIAQLRHKLGDDARAPRYIQTVHGVGFRLIANVTATGPADSALPPDQATPPRRRPQGDRQTIAVLPFVNMSGDKENEYFSDGIAEEILNRLTKLPQLKVSSRTSSFFFKGSQIDIPTVAEKLGVATVLEGSVRRAGSRVRISAQLIEAASDSQLWAETYDRELADVFAIQDDIARSIVQALELTLNPREQRALHPIATTNVSAYDFYLRGRQFIDRFHKRDIEFARQMYRQAIDLDPGFALAWAGYADCFSLLIMYADPVASYREEARHASQRALELDPNLAEAHAAHGLALLISNEFEAVEAEFNKAIELNPRLYQAYYYHARARFHQGDLTRAAELFQKAAEVEPADYQSRCLRVQILRGTGRMEEAVAQARDAVRVLEKHIEWNPDDARALHLGAGSLVVLGDEERAKSWLKRALELNPDDSVLLYNVACNFALLGETEEALGFLERAAGQGTVSADWMRNDTDLASLHANPRFHRVLRQLDEKGAATGN